MLEQGKSVIVLQVGLFFHTLYRRLLLELHPGFSSVLFFMLRARGGLDMWIAAAIAIQYKNSLSLLLAHAGGISERDGA